jgi:hypothetical protein
VRLQRKRGEQSHARLRAGVNPREARGLFEAALDEIDWLFCWRLSLLLDELLVREERGA